MFFFFSVYYFKGIKLEFSLNKTNFLYCWTSRTMPSHGIMELFLCQLKLVQGMLLNHVLYYKLPSTAVLQCFPVTCVFVGGIWPRFNRQVHWGGS